MVLFTTFLFVVTGLVFADSKLVDEANLLKSIFGEHADSYESAIERYMIGKAGLHEMQTMINEADFEKEILDSHVLTHEMALKATEKFAAVVKAVERLQDAVERVYKSHDWTDEVLECCMLSAEDSLNWKPEYDHRFNTEVTST